MALAELKTQTLYQDFVTKMAIKLNVQNVLSYLRDKKYDAQLQSETQQVYILFNFDGVEFPLFVRVDEGPKVLQLFMFMPCSVNPKTFGDTARLLHLLNKEVDMPGFGMEEKAGVLFFRWVFPTPSGEVQEPLLDKFLTAIPQVSKICFPVIASVANGTVSYDAAANQVKTILDKFTSSEG